MTNEQIIQKNPPHYNILFPDPLTKPHMLSGALFLYFDEPIWVTMPPIVMTPDSWELLTLIKERKPEWGETFWNIFGAWRQVMDGYRSSVEILGCLKEDSLKTMYMSYPTGVKALAETESLIKSAGFTLAGMSNFIDPVNSSGEIIRHIMLEQFLELNQNIDSLFNYCRDLFKKESLPDLLTKGYLLRLNMLKGVKNFSILLSNEALTQFLEKMPVETNIESYNRVDVDVITWELFRQIVSPFLDPLDVKRAELICRLIKSRKGEIVRLRSKCSILADQLSSIASLDKLVEQVQVLIRKEVANEISDLLELDKRALTNFLNSLFSDRTTWIAAATTIGGIIAGQPNVAVGGAIYALSNVGAQAVSESAKHNEKIRQSDYALVYRIGRRKLA